MNEDDAKAWLEARVSRETMDRLQLLHTQLLRWQNTVNLVAPSTLGVAWSRHFVDSAQLYRLAAPQTARWLDFGSGGGFPGLVIAAIGVGENPDFKMTLVESDVRKCGFMREAARLMNLKVNILTRRIADIPPQKTDVISARALSNLKNLMDFAKPHLNQSTCLLFPKGSSYQTELDEISEDWQSKAEVIPSLTDPDAVVLRFRAANEKEQD
ncbi:16S rRNA (guanine(527)-N(7))-methyltransferase RsmG [Gymnodinialimonas ceratoperidinii]|uniref:Ribosomal RNA small subunit methyltransferase G n=1 Tax=Gymnodinialimonas ceratoperidinii TaxID=2856823 RepID=A0A8F6TXY6_9RHOB|nr:16S rRNA (guanine(527)-N(7))-methyltransferase RsmG [Gymnodinialimonas ceratoperidinii]QXT40004.1 16S rRNA (guanine(527)-N(7))-methyltransferase RsmG [Gymnodinialimonas ceratoperidinii]